MDSSEETAAQCSGRSQIFEMLASPPWGRGWRVPAFSPAGAGWVRGVAEESPNIVSRPTVNSVHIGLLVASRPKYIQCRYHERGEKYGDHTACKVGE